MTDLNPQQKLTRQGRGLQGVVPNRGYTYLYANYKPRYRDGSNEKGFPWLSGP